MRGPCWYKLPPKEARLHTYTNVYVYLAAMVQTKAGAKTNEWLLFMQGCRATYHEHKASLPPKPKISPKNRQCKRPHRVSPCESAHLRQVESRTRLTLDAYATDQTKRSAFRSNECGTESGVECEVGEPPLRESESEPELLSFHSAPTPEYT